MATVDYPNAPRRLSMLDFKSVADADNSLVKACRFASVIKPQGGLVQQFSSFARDLTYLCEITDIPGRNFYYYTGARYYGPGFNVMFMSDYQDFNMSFLCRTKSYEREFFDNWMNVINPVNTYDFNYRDDYRSEIDVYQFGESTNNPISDAPDAQYKITVMDAYPVMIQPQPASWSDQDFQRLIVTFTCTKWIRKGIDPESRTGSAGGFSYSLVEGRKILSR